MRSSWKKKLMLGWVDHILFEDESVIRAYQALSRSWFPCGRQRRVPTYGSQGGARLFGVLDYVTGGVHVREYSKGDAASFLHFLESVLLAYPEGKIVLILDNARIHHALLLKDFLEKHKDRLRLMFLPPYSPDLNLIEGFWGWLKDSVVNNVFFKSIKEIGRSVKDFVSWVNSKPFLAVDRLCLRI